MQQMKMRSHKEYWENNIKKFGRFRSIGRPDLSDEINKIRKEAKFKDLDEILETFKKNKKIKILDAGCGTGIYTEYFLKKGGDVVAVDFAENAIKYISKSVNNSNGVVADLSHLPFKNCVFDVVSCMSVLYHITDDTIWKEALKELRRVLKKGSILLLQIEWSDTEQEFEHYKRRNKKQYKMVFKELGLNIIEIRKLLEVPTGLGIFAKYFPFFLKLNLFKRTTDNVLLVLEYENKSMQH